MTNRQRKKRRRRLLTDFGFSNTECDVLEELAAKRDISPVEALRGALRLYQAQSNSTAEMVWKNESFGVDQFD